MTLQPLGPGYYLSHLYSLFYPHLTPSSLFNIPLHSFWWKTGRYDSGACELYKLKALHPDPWTAEMGGGGSWCSFNKIINSSTRPYLLNLPKHPNNLKTRIKTNQLMEIILIKTTITINMLFLSIQLWCYRVIHFEECQDS